MGYGEELLSKTVKLSRSHLEQNGNDAILNTRWTPGSLSTATGKGLVSRRWRNQSVVPLRRFQAQRSLRRRSRVLKAQNVVKHVSPKRCDDDLPPAVLQPDRNSSTDFTQGAGLIAGRHEPTVRGHRNSNSRRVGSLERSARRQKAVVTTRHFELFCCTVLQRAMPSTRLDCVESGFTEMGTRTGVMP